MRSNGPCPRSNGRRASAVANSGLGLFDAAADVVDGSFRSGVIRQIGLEQPEAVRLAVGPSIDATTQGQIKQLSDEIISGRLEVRTTYEGLEFQTPA